MPALPAPLAILDVGGTEILIIMLVALLLFGSERRPGLARSLGKSIREFKKATAGLEEELRRAMEEPTTPPASRHPFAPVEVTVPPKRPDPIAEMASPAAVLPVSAYPPEEPPSPAPLPEDTAAPPPPPGKPPPPAPAPEEPLAPGA